VRFSADAIAYAYHEWNKEADRKYKGVKIRLSERKHGGVTTTHPPSIKNWVEEYRKGTYESGTIEDVRARSRFELSFDQYGTDIRIAHPSAELTRVVMNILSESEKQQESPPVDDRRQEPSVRVTQLNVVPRIFVGHGGPNSLWRELKDYVEQFNVQVETFETQPRFGKTAKEVLREMLDRADLAFLIHTGEDETAENRMRARQNVVHETGLFQGKLGFDRAIVLREEGCEDFSNLSGVQEIRFPVGNIRAAFGDVASVLRTTFPGV
jgi:predicted nucleotide-binding protein